MINKYGFYKEFSNKYAKSINEQSRKEFYEQLKKENRLVTGERKTERKASCRICSQCVNGNCTNYFKNQICEEYVAIPNVSLEEQEQWRTASLPLYACRYSNLLKNNEYKF